MGIRKTWECDRCHRSSATGNGWHQVTVHSLHSANGAGMCGGTCRDPLHLCGECSDLLNAALDSAMPDTLNAITLLTIRIPSGRIIPVVLGRLMQIFRDHPGGVLTRVWSGDDDAGFLVMPPQRLSGSGELLSELRALLGPSCLDEPNADLRMG